MPALLGHISGIATLPAVRPLLLLISADSNRFPDTIEAWTQLIRNATDAADWLELPNSSHLSFTFSQLLSPLLVPDGFEPQRGLRVIDKYLRIFFDAHLRDGPTPALGPAPGTMDVHWHTR